MHLACIVHVSCMYFDMSRYPQSRVCVTGVQQCVYTGVQQRRAVSRKLSDPVVGLSECGVSISVFMRLFCLSWLGLSWTWFDELRKLHGSGSMQQKHTSRTQRGSTQVHLAGCRVPCMFSAVPSHHISTFK